MTWTTDPSEASPYPDREAAEDHAFRLRTWGHECATTEHLFLPRSVPGAPLGERPEPDFFDLARAELSRAREKFGPINGPHEGYAVLLEEVEELWDAVKSQRPAENPAHFLLECVQIAAMAGRFAVDLGLLDLKRGAFTDASKDGSTLRKLRDRSVLRASGSPESKPLRDPAPTPEEKP